MGNEEKKLMKHIVLISQQMEMSRLMENIMMSDTIYTKTVIVPCYCQMKA